VNDILAQVQKGTARSQAALRQGARARGGGPRRHQPNLSALTAEAKNGKALANLAVAAENLEKSSADLKKIVAKVERGRAP